MNERYEILKQLSNLIDMGYSLSQALSISEKIYSDSLSSKMKTLLAEGYMLPEIFKKLKFDRLWIEYFDFFYSNLSLSKAINDSLMVIQLKDSLLSNIKKKFMYPIFLLIFVILFSFVAIYILFPKILLMMEEFSVSLTLLQKVLFICLSTVPYLLIFLVILIILIVVTIIKAFYKQDKKKIITYMSIKIINEYLQLYFSLKFAVYYQQLVNSGYDTKTCIEILRKKIGESDLIMVIEEIYQEILNGNEIDKIIANCRFFNQHFKITYQIMLENGLVNESLVSYITMTISLIEAKIQKLIKIVLPIIYGFVGILVVMIYVMIVLPMLNIVTAL